MQNLLTILSFYFLAYTFKPTLVKQNAGLRGIFWTVGCVIGVTEYSLLGITEYPLQSNGISLLRGNILSRTEYISYSLPITYHIPIY